ncbi:recombination-associated protein RdgC [Psychrosphaera aquimarina]|uniref:Recombination-associated protein RdgC n=1 Tax=Psychrosphaera aquimarina TaxID=2044854 RepID=A0ABU3R0A7_9GAMM|nr:recombination-associated protein RdgC [Psychrosphaera aquimarina]MDU0113121.1 recombination-associated protein RdgC [Psychrosphaera aquimarina]
MWFNNAFIYQFTKPFDTPNEELESSLNEHLFRPCGSQDQLKQGWVSAIPGTSNMVHVAGKNALVCLKTEEKVLPSSVVKDALEEKVQLLQNERGQKVGKKEKQTLKEEIVQQLLPKAFTKSSRLYAYINTEKQIIVVNTSSANKAENLLAFLRQSLGSLPILPHKPDGDLIVTMTHWVKNNDLPSPFTFANDIELKALDEEAAAAKLKNHDVTEEEVQLHITNGKYVHKLALVWAEKIKFNLNEDAALKQVKFLDIVKEQNDDFASDDHLAKFDADFALMTGELNELIEELATTWTNPEEN